jgi:hypothetical protein
VNDPEPLEPFREVLLAWLRNTIIFVVGAVVGGSLVVWYYLSWAHRFCNAS